MNDIFEKIKKDFEEFMAEAQKLIEEKNTSTGYCNTITPDDVLIFNKPAKRSD